MNITSPGNSGEIEKKKYSVRVEKDLFALEDYINDVWQFLPIPVAYLNPLGVILDISHSLEKLLGFKKEELVGGTLINIFTERETLRRIQDLTLQKSGVNNHECVIRLFCCPGRHITAGVGPAGTHCFRSAVPYYA
jgi:PAS domain S-box-containing protein